MLASIARRVLPRSIRNWLSRAKFLYRYASASVSYSQEGEDRILARIFEGKSKGFYVDVGALDPYRFSNTSIFYARGWGGINIDPNPAAIARFNKIRKRDTNIHAAISDKNHTVTYYLFDEPAYNTIDDAVHTARISENDQNVVGTIQVETTTLRSVLEQHLPSGQTIDFLSIDVEGVDLEVLKSNDWDRYRPSIVLFEETKGKLLAPTPSGKYLEEKGYVPFGKTFNTHIYMDKEFYNKNYENS